MQFRVRHTTSVYKLFFLCVYFCCVFHVVQCFDAGGRHQRRREDELRGVFEAHDGTHGKRAKCYATVKDFQSVVFSHHTAVRCGTAQQDGTVRCGNTSFSIGGVHEGNEYISCFEGVKKNYDTTRLGYLRQRTPLFVRCDTHISVGDRDRFDELRLRFIWRFG